MESSTREEAKLEMTEPTSWRQTLYKLPQVPLHSVCMLSQCSVNCHNGNEIVCIIDDIKSAELGPLKLNGLNHEFNTSTGTCIPILSVTLSIILQPYIRYSGIRQT